MEWTNREVLKRIAALLFALADLADRASFAPPSVRAQLLAILGHAKVVAQALALGMACDLGVAMPPQAGLDSGDPDDMTRLAYSLRVLALVLANLLALAEFSISRGHIGGAATIDLFRNSIQPARCCAPAPDT